MNKNGVKIASINGAEVVKLNNGKWGEIKNNCVISNSLLLDKLQEIGLNINKKGSTKDIINVKFDYGYKSAIAKEFDCNVENLRNELAQLKLANKWIKEQIYINKIFYGYEDFDTEQIELIKTNKINNKDIIMLKKEIERSEKFYNENIIGKENLREQLYKEGFDLEVERQENKETIKETIHYVFWFRTAGKAKNGADYFIREELHNTIDKWQRMGIELPEKDAKLVEMEVYKSLVSSAITDYIKFNPRTEILVVNDLDCYTELQDVISVYRADNGDSKAKHTKKKCKNTIWDGMALIQGGEGFRGLRHHMYKTGAFCSDFQQYFKEQLGEDYNDYKVTDRYGRELLLKDVRMITTENAMKWEKFLGNTKEAFEQWCTYVEENECKFGICKENHISKYGSKQRMSYQMLNSLPISKEEVAKIFTETGDFVDALKNNPILYIEHLKRTANTTNNNMLLADLVETYPTFYNSKYYRNNKAKSINAYVNTLKEGKLLATGDNETIVGNPMLLLDYVLGRLDNNITDGVITDYIDKTLPNANSCYCRRFKNGDEIGAFRSPHNSPNNILYFVNNRPDVCVMDKYFSNLGNNVIVANMLYTDIQDRGNGLDEDTDFLYCTTNKTIVEACKKAQEYPTIVNNFKPSKKTYNNTPVDLAKVDNGLQASQKAIGTSSNVAQLFLSQYWNLYEAKISAQTMIDNVAILSVLAQVAVDSAKRAYEVGDLSSNALNKEIARLRKELPSSAKPTFWQYTSSAFENKEIEKKLKNNNKDKWNKLTDKEKKLLVKEEKVSMIEELVDYNCPINFALKEIDNINGAKRGSSLVDNINFVRMELKDKKAENRKQADKIQGLIETLEKVGSFINVNGDMEEEEADKYYNIIYNETIEEIKKLKIKQETMVLLLQRAFNTNNKNVKSNKDFVTKMLNVLYNNNRDVFISCFKDYTEEK